MLTETRAANRVHWVAELTSGSTTLRYAEEAVASESEGFYKPYIVSWGEIPSDLGDDSFSFITPRSSFTFFDADRSFQNLLAESAAGTLLEFVFELWVRSFYVSASNHYRRLAGRVRNYRLVRNRTWEVVYGPNDEQFDLPLRFSAINKAENQVSFGAGGGNDVPDEAVGNPTQIVYGEQNSAGTDVTGAVPASLIARPGSNNYWFATWGRINPTDNIRVWADGTEKTSVVTVAPTTSTIGKAYMAFWASEANIPSTADVRFDLKTGIDETLSSFVNPITNPIAILRHILTNFVFQEWAGVGGTWLSEAGQPLDATVLDTAEAFCDTHGIVGSAVYQSGTLGRAVINDFAQSVLCHIFWTTAFELAALFDDYGVRDTYLTSDEELRQDKGHFLSDLSMDSGGDKQVKDVIVNSAFIGGTSKRERRVTFEKSRRQAILNIKIGNARFI